MVLRVYQINYAIPFRLYNCFNISPGTWANGLSRLEDVTLAEGLYSAYHRYMRQFCSTNPDRLKSITLAQAADIEWAVSEVKAVSQEKWVVAVAPVLPEGMPVDHPDLDPLWEVMNDAHLPILHHSFTFEAPYLPGYRDIWGNVVVCQGRRQNMPVGRSKSVPPERSLASVNVRASCSGEVSQRQADSRLGG